MTAAMGEDRLAEIQGAVDAYGRHFPTGFACCSAHAPADAAQELLAEVTRQRKVIMRLTGGADAGIQRVRLHKSEAGDWRVRWMLDGRRKAKTFPTETEAQDWAKELKAGAL